MFPFNATLSAPFILYIRVTHNYSAGEITIDFAPLNNFSLGLEIQVKYNIRVNSCSLVTTLSETAGSYKYIILYFFSLTSLLHLLFYNFNSWSMIGLKGNKFYHMIFFFFFFFD